VNYTTLCIAGEWTIDFSHHHL